ncbi:MAG: UDP-N-acetylmuramoyl-tripeptide--D-alanyl-D-alanine ligase [bacterium]|nr:UDP-N-acetylmuramoyl-tripeptide--D-alanyl-D-alanine ligase [bacterium]
MTLALQTVARTIHSTGTPPPLMVSGWSVDSRTVAGGDLFFALRGPNHDGHDHVAQALAGGAVAAVVEREVEAPGTLLRVRDTYAALGALAGWARQDWAGKVVAVTGSAGKTTTKDAIAHLLAGKHAVGKTMGNLNNHVGLPLSILRLPEAARVAVLEMGMNHAGEIRALSAIAKPEIGVVTNVGYAHAENFDSLAAVAAAKRELIDSLQPGGTAVLNADDERVAAFAASHDGPVVTFGFSEGADVHAVEMDSTAAGARFRVADGGWFETSFEGRHGVSNILAALAVGRVFGHAPAEFTEAVAALEAGEMRDRRLVHNGITIFESCYNSNPEAVHAMLEVLSRTPARRRIAVLGEMLELGRWAEPLHRDIGRRVAVQGIHVLIGIRGAARHIVEAAVEAGLPASAAYFFETPEEAGEYLRTQKRAGDVVLFKGSRGTRVELALQRFI